MTSHGRDCSLRWCDQGTRLFRDALSGCSDDELAGPTVLPGWTGKHLVAHVAANAEALHNLVQWAATGVVTPMYSSPRQRTDDIDSGARLSGPELRQWVDRSAVRLSGALTALAQDRWDAPVRTAQGRIVPATEIPWLRARETMVHSVDLGSMVTVGDLPDGFLLALVSEVAAKRSAGPGPALELTCTTGNGRWTIDGDGDPVPVRGSLAALAAYLTGRPGPEVAATAPGAVPALPSWL